MDDKQFILRPLEWPHWPFLPMKRYTKGRQMETATLPAIDGFYSYTGKMTLLLIPLFDIEKDSLKSANKKEYDNVDALLADGWIVD